MEIGIVGLGRMGGNMARRLARAGVRVVGFDRDSARCDAIAAFPAASGALRTAIR
jgi:6-phosphogluconate dehydrogenase